MGESTGSAWILRPGEGRSIHLGGFRMAVKAAAGDTNGAFSLLEAEEPPGFGPPLHIHRDAAEAFYVLSGEYVIYLNGSEASCPAGSFIFIPAGVLHGFRVGNMPSRKLNLYTPAAMVGYFDDIAEALKAGEGRRHRARRNRSPAFDGRLRAGAGRLRVTHGAPWWWTTGAAAVL